MKTFRKALVAALVISTFPVVIHAQGGCVDSPEASTDVLMLVGSIGMICGSSLAMKILRRDRKA
jgi:XrtJ-associated TM-motif-TM protein